MTDVTVIVGNYNGELVLGDCLASLEKQTLRPREVFVADASSSDRSLEIACRYGSHVIAAPNHGLGYLYNKGAAAAVSPLLLLLNNDVALDEHCVEELAGALGDEDVFAADARQIDWNHGRTIHARTTLRRGSLVKEYIPGLHLKHDVPTTGTVPTVSANGAAMLVRRDMMCALGGFDETFYMEWEDLDLCWRAWLRGWRTLYVPTAVVRHRVGAVTTAREQPRRSASSHHNLVRFALKCLPPSAAVRVIAGELLRIPKHPRAVIFGLAAAAREINEISTLRRRVRPTKKLLAWMLGGQE